MMLFFNNIKIINSTSFTTPAPERARLGAELQQLYAEGKFAEILAQVDACLPKDEAGNFIAEQEKSDVVHDLLAFLAERMLEMNKQKQQEIKGFLGWLESYLGAKGGGPHAQDQSCRATTSTITRAFWRCSNYHAHHIPAHDGRRSGQLNHLLGHLILASLSPAGRGA